jgi:hypothetical protein
VILLFEFAVIALFPAAVTWAWRTGKASRVYSLTIAALALFVAFALFVSSPWGGNRLVATDGFWLVAVRVFFFYGLVVALPILVSSFAVLVASPRIQRPIMLYVLASGAAFVTFVAGTLLALFTML